MWNIAFWNWRCCHQPSRTWPSFHSLDLYPNWLGVMSDVRVCLIHEEYTVHDLHTHTRVSPFHHGDIWHTVMYSKHMCLSRCMISMYARATICNLKSLAHLIIVDSKIWPTCSYHPNCSVGRFFVSGSPGARGRRGHCQGQRSPHHPCDKAGASAGIWGWDKARSILTSCGRNQANQLRWSFWETLGEICHIQLVNGLDLAIVFFPKRG